MIDMDGLTIWILSSTAIVWTVLKTKRIIIALEGIRAALEKAKDKDV